MTQLHGVVTLAEIKACTPCADQWEKALACFPSPPDMSTKVSLGDIALRTDASTAWWCVRALDWSDIAVRRSVILVLLLSVERAATHTDDKRVHDCIVALRAWCSGDDSIDLNAAARAAWAAADAAAWAAADAAARAAADAAARAADAAADAAWAADAARAADAADAAADAAWAAEQKTQVNDLIAAFPPLHKVD